MHLGLEDARAFYRPWRQQFEEGQDAMGGYRPFAAACTNGSDAQKVD